ncbi:MAG: helix-turn-helix domain-containing protein [Geodermatophilaceae bacterium]|nr:helix-turn-helix domain-containing protein [Geodermatophilaceae bacterium]
MPALPDLERRAQMYAALGEPLRLAIVDQLTLGDSAPGELGRALDIPTNLLAHHLRVLEEAGLISRVRSEGDRRRSYVRLRSDLPTVGALRDRDGGRATEVGAPHPRIGSASRVVFVCTHNSARSQLAAAVWKGLSATPAASAGTHPSGRVHPRALAVGRRHGLRLSRTATAHTDEVLREDDLVIAVCDNAYEELATAGPRPRLHWSIPDPVRIDTDDAFEAAYQDIADRVDRLARAVNPANPPPSRTR